MPGFGTSIKSSAPVGVAGKLFTSLFFFLFLGMGSVFVFFVAREALAGLRTWTWKKADCQIVASSVRDKDEQGRQLSKFKAEVTYHYSFEGQSFTANQYRRSEQSFSDYTKATHVVGMYQAGKDTVCYVNPKAPGQAVLERDSPFMMLVVLFPMIFVTIGAGGIYLTWRTRPAPAARLTPISDKALAGARAQAAFFMIFFLMGTGFFYGFFIRPLLGIMGAKSWSAVPCVVLLSQV